jgi:2-oxoglutarate/2-oxoacid ferredoxin oxidoreductase subunit alpha
VNEFDIDPAKLIRVLHFDGTPITARFITQAIINHVHAEVVAPKRKPREKAL